MSVVIVVSSAREAIAGAVRGIVRQTLADWELIVVDDAGDGNTVRGRIEDVADPRVNVLVNAVPLGRARSLALGAAEARGRYLVFHGADDVSAPERLAVQAELLDREPSVSAVGSNARLLDDSGVEVGEFARRWPPHALDRFQKVGAALLPGATMLRRAAFDACAGLDTCCETACEFDLLRRLRACGELRCVDRPLYACRATPELLAGIAAPVPPRDALRSGSGTPARGAAAALRPAAAPARVDAPPAVSVLMANYNNARYLAAAIESVLAQSCREWELVILDDRSTDDSLQVAERYQDDPRIRVLVSEANAGYVAALNRLTREARAPIVVTLDSDDALTPDALEKVVGAHALNPNASMVYSQYVFCDAALRPSRIGTCATVPAGSSALIADCVSHLRSFRKDMLVRVGGFDPRILYAEDKDIIFKMEEVGELVFVDDVLYLYRVLAQSQSNGWRAPISRMSRIVAEAHAQARRRGTRMPRLERGTFARELHLGLGLALRTRHPRLALRFAAWILAGGLVGPRALQVMLNALVTGTTHADASAAWRWHLQRKLAGSFATRRRASRGAGANADESIGTGARS